ncbi:helicase with zinc finger domain 2 isoform X2 [Hemiscyllium ocellatum]|uniref:helicase with zinc finger domain 2 isoform X2 n=1 Tax=Hemiscyllium ocellatum TaxID=170820 RepID=UPI0029670093|nr:helicase with zinc finger domain 2 isoform X2 [Hemiscyllium ocellatum]
MKGGEDLFKVLDLQLLCSQCFEKTNESTIVLKNVNHKCQQLQLVARKQQNRNGSWRLIRRRPAFINPARYQVCSFYREGSGCKRMKNRCTFAWSEEEAFVWNYERQNQIERHKLKKLIAERTNNGSPCSGTANKQQTVEEEIVNEFEGQFTELCAICFYSVPQQLSYQNIHKLCSFSSQHGWSPLLVHVLEDNSDMKQCNEIRPVSSPNNLQYCKHVLQGVSCHDLKNCSFAHSEVELMVWKSETHRGLKRLTLLQLSQQQNWNGKPGAERVAENNVQFYCSVCLVIFSSQDKFENHCTSIEHIQMVLTDTTVVWNHREPSLKANKYQLCSRLDICEFGENCIHAHSHKELEEWLMRSEVAQKRKQSAKHQGLLSYQDRILEEYRNCRNEILIMSEEVDDVLISCDCALRIPYYKRRSKLKWNFHIKSQKPLLFVALLKREPGAVFWLEGKDIPKKCVISEGIKFRISETTYHVGVLFEAGTLGTYDQWVVFDFGSRPLLVRKIYVSKTNAFQPPENPNTDAQFVNLERWHSGNRRIVPCMEKTENELLVLQEYKSPALSLEYKVKDMANIPITRVNYRERMHNFLYREEQAEEDVVSRAADLYVKDYFHFDVNTGNLHGRPLRMKYVKQNPIHTDPITKQYCLLSNSSFVLPDRSTLESYRIVITTCMEAKLFSELKLPLGFFTHILIDEAAQMLECDALIPLALASNKTRIVLAGDHMQMSPKLFSIENNEMADYTLLNRLFQFYQKEKHDKATKSRIIFRENYRSVKEIIHFVSMHFYMLKTDVIQASGNIQPHPQFYPLMFCYVHGISSFNSSKLSWYNEAEVLQVVEKVESVLNSWPVEWGQLNPSSVCVVSSEGFQIQCLRHRLRQCGYSTVTVENVFNIQGKQFRVMIISTVHTCESSTSSKSANLEFFNQSRVLNTAMTRAQSLVIVVGDAVALCSVGNCSKIWKNYIQECIDNQGIYPEDLTMEQIKQAVIDTENWACKAEDENDNDSCCSDPILQELLDESKNVTLTVTEEGLMDIVVADEIEPEENINNQIPAGATQSLQKRKNAQYTDYPLHVLHTLLLTQPSKYKRCEIIMEKFYKGYAVTLDDPQSIHIKIKGRLNCGHSFPGDQVLVEILDHDSGQVDNTNLSGKVVGVLKAGDLPRIFICTVDEYDSHVMIPINKCVTKLYTPPVDKKSRNKIPIRKRKKDKFVTTQIICLTEEIRRNNFFVVELLCWRRCFYLPLGIVTKMLPAAVTMETGMEILNLEYQIHDSYPKEILKEIAKYSQTKNILEGNRKDCRKYLTFTVDHMSSTDLDDAISVRELGDNYEIGIHIADVASFVPRGSCLDREALKRGVTHYPPGRDPIHMLPPKLSEEVCSLLPEKPRKVISLFVVVQKSTDKVVKANFSLSVIQSDRKLSYDEAEDILNCFSGSELRFDTLEDSVATAFHFSRVHRKCRLENDCYYDQADEERHLGNRKSQQMIEELMIMMNSFVAEFLTNKTKTVSVTPLRCQGSPASQQLAKLENKHRNLISLSIHLSHHLDITPNVQSPPCEKFQILSSLWSSLIKAAKDNDIHRLADFIATDDIHPNLAPVTMELRKLMHKSFFVRSSSTALSRQGHYSLQLESYTWATSPIRRYLDIIIQRLLTMVLCREADLPYSKQEIDNLCMDFNRKNRTASNYEKKAQCLHFATQLRSQVVQKLVFAVEVESLARCFKVIFPLKYNALSELLEINYRTLQLVDQPAYNESTKSMKLTWRKRIYCLETTRNSILPPAPFCNPHVCTINANTWQQVVQAVRLERFSEVAALLLENSEGVKSNGKQGHFGKIDVSKCQISSVSHYVHISLEVKNGDALQLQLSTDIKNGFLVPAVQLLSITPAFEICIEHAENPIICFSEYASKSPQKTYNNAKEYQRIWGPLCAMESASSSVCENEVIVIYDVKITWKRENTHAGKLQGTFCIPKEFCKNWHVGSALTNCYLCIRCKGLKKKLERNLTGNDEALHLNFKALHISENSSELNIDPDNYIWVAHAVTEEFQNDGPKSDRETYNKTIFSVYKTTMDMIPNEIFQKETKFVVEIIPKLLPDLRKERAIQNLPNSSQLAQNIALGQHIPPTNNSELPSNVLKQTNYSIPEFEDLNRSQVQAVQRALRSPFALIQGPPGTGKTVVGVHIVYWFHRMNYDYNNQNYPLDKEDKDKRCILYCGPSNKSVNVVAEYLLNLQKYLKPLRVYSEQMEMVDFPYPGSQLMISKKSVREGKPKPILRPITLHYKIREPSNPFASRIKAYDEMIQNGTTVTEEDIEEYKRLLSKARKHELRCHDVILCTCATSSSKVLQELSVRQILVDESAMCTEPELLIPIVAHKQANQIVLLGDHKQLRPIISNEFCRRLGMETSLFERYDKQALMLNVQYRMHKEICQFPSQMFYNGKLETDPKLERRPQSVFYHRGKMTCPIIFGHVLGDEISLMVSTEEGNENSRANKLEAEKAVFIVKQLTFAKIKPSDIAVLTPYNAQVLEISKLFNAKGITGVTVCTIIKSQGSEWRYVILSAVRSLPQREIDMQPSKSWLKKYLGFITDPNQVNVALTRAKEGLCILGNEYLLRCSNPWKDLLAHYRKKNALVNADDITVRK